MNYLWPFRKTKAGLFIVCGLIIALWGKYVLPLYGAKSDLFVPYTEGTVFLIFVTFMFWFIHSARIVIPRKKFTIVFAFKEKDQKSTRYIQDAISMLRGQLDTLKILPKFRILQAGSDFINDMESAHKYRNNFDLDIVIWGDIFTGKKEEKELCNFDKLHFTFKVPGSIVARNLSEIFTKDVNIALVKRDWNVYEMNSIPDVEKIAGHLSESIMFVVGLIYCVSAEGMVEDSIVILENLLSLLEVKTKGEKVETLQEGNQIRMSPSMLRRGRVLDIILNSYKNMGRSYLNRKEYDKAHFYCEKFRAYHNRDCDVLGNLALCAYHRNDIAAARNYTEEIGIVSRKNGVYLLNCAFFHILDGNYDAALVFYKKFLRAPSAFNGSLATQVIAFMDQRKAERPEEHAYDFCIGFLNYYFCSPAQGEAELLEFLAKAQDKREYASMISYAQQTLFPQKSASKSKRKKTKAKK